MPSLITTITLALVVAAGAGAQHISEGELQRLATNGRFPIGCQTATLAAYGLRANPAIDPARLRDAAQTYRACATGPYGTGSNKLALQSNFNAAAALLLAARHEAPAAARADATDAQTLAQIVIDFRQPPGYRGPSRNPDPSPLITDAERIDRDAAALLASLDATPVVPS